VPALIRYPPRQFPHQTSHHTSTYHLATLLTIPLVISLLLFWAVTRGSADLVGAWETLPQSYFVLFTVLLLLPFHRLSRSGRHRFFVALRRVSIGGSAEAQDGKFGDILLSDALTSYSKIFAKLFLHVFLVRCFEHGQARPQLWRRCDCAPHRRHTLHNSVKAVPNRKAAVGADSIWRTL
jgi:EXS family